ncbi:sigma-54 dependent transcriptional regulator [Desulfovibrio sp. OttesenSCG-928-I05]|nr:sigma-54 dependent transcriptional regulator [Desulfovibrio sp. OttesenSCG-928-I05]
MSRPPAEPDSLAMRLAAMCEQIACGNYDKAKDVFDLPDLIAGGENADAPTVVLAEAIAMMALRIEAREFERDRLLAEISEAREELEKHRGRLAEENRRLRAKIREEGAGPGTIGGIVGQDPAMLLLLSQAERIAPAKANVLITGETGAGKGVLARHIHDLSPRAGKPFVDINCAAIPASLLESELFGIESGVASGVQSRIGRFEQANGGTLLLDEIGDMPLESQAKILHILENGMVERVGGRKKIHVNVRIMAATHRDIEKLVEEKQFREDLFYRLNVVHLHVPPLRERPADIPALARKILEDMAGRFSDAPRRVSPDALSLLMHYPWPGNIRELHNVLERASLMAEGSKITAADLPPALHAALHNTLGGDVRIAGQADLTDQKDHAMPGRISTLDEAMAEHINKALRAASGNKSLAARILGISREGLRMKLSRMDTE